MNGCVQALTRKLESLGELSDEDRVAIEVLEFHPVLLQEGEDAVREGDRPNQCCLVIDGLLHRYKLLGNGTRQILAFHTAGDVPDLQSFKLEVMDHSLAAAVTSNVAYIPHPSLEATFKRVPSLAQLMWRDSLVDAAIFRAWIVCMGRRDAESHMAHLFCELFTRLRAVSLSNGKQCHLPLTQAELADAVGISAVHVNRTLSKLRNGKLVDLRGDKLTILDWEGLVEKAEFDPRYLQLRELTGASDALDAVSRLQVV